MPPIDFHRSDHAVQVDGEAGHAASADAGLQVGVELEKLFFEGGQIHVVCVVFLEDTKDLLLDLTVGGALEGYPDIVVAVLHFQGREVLEVLGELAVVIVADVEIRENLYQAGADLAQAGFLAFCAVVCDDACDRCLDGGLIGEESFGIAVIFLIDLRLFRRLGIGGILEGGRRLGDCGPLSSN